LRYFDLLGCEICGFNIWSSEAVLTLYFLFLALGTGCAQGTNGDLFPNDAAQNPITPTESTQTLDPLSTNLEPVNTSGPKSSLMGDIQASTGAENFPSLTSANSSQFSWITQVLGNLTVRHAERRSQTSIYYNVGERLFHDYNNVEFYNQQSHWLGAEQTFQWKRGQIRISDVFSYTGNWSFGLSSPSGITPPNILTVFDSTGATQSGPAYVNNAVACNISENLTKRSSAKFSAAYSMTDYISNTQGFFNSREVSTQAEYDYKLSQRNSVGITYAYQDFQFIPTVEELVANSAQFVFHRQIAKHMNLVLGAGPQRIVASGLTSKFEIGPSVQASFNYHAKKNDLSLSYNRIVTSGAGYYAGGIQDIASSSFDWKFSPSWQATVNAGYNRVSEIALSATGTVSPQFDYWFAGTIVQRRLGRNLSAIASYQFNKYATGSCGLAQICNPALHPSIILIGIDWAIHGVRLE
jgi:hypothetical protein